MSNRISRFEFENYALLPSERLLMHNGQPVPLKSRAFDTLLTLIRHRGQLLSKEELMGKIWGESFVEEGNLTQNIFVLRKIFGEKPHDHRFIVTVSGRGYQFVAKVREIVDSSDSTRHSHNGHSKNGYVRSLAILPLKSLPASAPVNNPHLGLAITDSLITQLNANQVVSVRPTEAVLKYAETAMDVVAIGRELGVDSILSGTIQTSGDKVRANFQLHEAGTGETLWASKIEARSGDVFELQDQISKQAATELTARINSGLTDRSAPKNLETFQTYVKYRFFWETRTETGLRKSLSGAKEIVATDPSFPLGYIGLADSYVLLGHHLFLSPAEILPAIRQAVDRALELDPNLAEAYATKADYCFITRDFAQAEHFHRISIKLKPNYASERHWFGWLLMSLGRFDESLEQIESAQMLDTGSLYLAVVRGVPFFYKRQFDRAIKQFQMVLDVDPNFSRARYYLGTTLFHSGEREKGIAELEKVVAAEPIQQTMALLGYCYGVTGQESKAREMLRKIDLMAGGRYISPYIRAYIHNGLGETDEALTQLEKAFEEDALWLVWLNIDMNLANLRDDPRFQRLIRKLNFPV